MNDKFNDRIETLLQQGQINHILRVLKDKCESLQTSDAEKGRLLSELENIKTTYFYLRKFLIENNPDPKREEILADLKKRIKALGRDCLFLMHEQSPDPLFSQFRLQKIRPASLQDLSLQRSRLDYRISKGKEDSQFDPSFLDSKNEELTDIIFNKVWSLPPWDLEELKTIEGMLRNPEYSWELKSQIVSALLLSLLKFNDPKKFLILLHFYRESDDERLQARSLMAIVMVLDRWKSSAVASPEISYELEEIASSIMAYSQIREIVTTIIRTRDTDRVSREVQEAFESSMKAISPELLDKLQKGGMTIDSMETGHNPEWENVVHNKEIEEKMQIINDMQMEGMDVMMQTFARLKSFPFFRLVSNWFLPFSTSHTLVKPMFEDFNEKGFLTMADATEMCNGDRFSFVLGILQMPASRRQILATNINGSFEMMNDQIKDRENVRKKSIFASEALAFARDLYRFAKLFPAKNRFYDPFSQPIDFLHLPILGSLLNDSEFIISSADFYFNHGYFSIALGLYREATCEGSVSRQIFEKMGFAAQMTGDISLALEYYEKADLFSSDIDRSSIWLLKKLAFCNKALGYYDKAADYYRRVLDHQPDDLKTEFHLGSVLLRAGRVHDGKILISKVYYLDPENKVCARTYRRLKGHDAFIIGNYEEALRLYTEAQGDQDDSSYRNDLAVELHSLNETVDLDTLRILLDK